MSRESYERQLIAVQQLERSEGWQAFAATLKAAEQSAYQAMTDAVTPHEMAKHLGAYHAIRNFRNWPERQMQALSAAIRGFTEQRRT